MPWQYINEPCYPAPMQDNLTQLRQRPMMQQTQMQPVQQGGVQWVNNEMEARSFLIAPNSAVALWDSSAPRVYLKQADASGKPSLKAYDLVERAETPVNAPNTPAVSYVTREEFDKLAALVGEIKGKKEKKRKIDEEDEDDE